MTTYSPAQQRELIAAVIATFPSTFGLRGFPGEVFRISLDASYFQDATAQALFLYAQRLVDGRWVDFAKGTQLEFWAQVVAP